MYVPKHTITLWPDLTFGAQMEAYIESTHPRVATPGEEQKCCCRTRKTMLREKHSICYTSTGSHAFVGGKDDKGELEAYGVGISLYFKYLKYLTVVYFVLTVLAVPALVIYSLGGKLSDVETSIQYLPCVPNLVLTLCCRGHADAASLFRVFPPRVHTGKPPLATLARVRRRGVLRARCAVAVWAVLTPTASCPSQAKSLANPPTTTLTWPFRALRAPSLAAFRPITASPRAHVTARHLACQTRLARRKLPPLAAPSLARLASSPTSAK